MDFDLKLTGSPQGPDAVDLRRVTGDGEDLGLVFGWAHGSDAADDLTALLRSAPYWLTDAVLDRLTLKVEHRLGSLDFAAVEERVLATGPDADLLKGWYAQVKWIEEHGGSLDGYVARYGSPGSFCYGRGGKAIFEADVGELQRIERVMLDRGEEPPARRAFPGEVVPDWRLDLKAERMRRTEPAPLDGLIFPTGLKVNNFRSTGHKDLLGIEELTADLVRHISRYSMQNIPPDEVLRLLLEGKRVYARRNAYELRRVHQPLHPAGDDDA